MNISSVLYFLVIALLSSTWALKYSKLSFPDITIRPSTEKEYPPCNEFLKTKPGLSEAKLMVTYAVSFHKSNDTRETLSPFSKEYSKCVWCQQKDVNCIEIDNADHQQFCAKKTYYVGPMNETCLLPQMENIQVILHKKYKTEMLKLNHPIAPEWTTLLLPKGFPKFVHIPIAPEWTTLLLPKGFPKFVHIPIGFLKKRNVPRERRNLELCSFPDGLETASLDCQQYPSYVKCTQSCAFGYTLQGGIQQVMKCLKKENVWRPVGFIECQPFVDCTVALTSGGSLKCSYMSLKTPPACTVSCSKYEDKDAVPTNTHTCDIKGKWDPPLPFCANPGQGLMLTTAPKKKLHD